MSQDDAYSKPDSELHSADDSGVVVPMPGVVGLALPDARATLQPFGFVINIIDEETLEVLAGIVRAQNPPPETPLPFGDPVDLTVSKVAPHPEHVPGTPPPPDVPLDP